VIRNHKIRINGENEATKNGQIDDTSIDRYWGMKTVKKCKKNNTGQPLPKPERKKKNTPRETSERDKKKGKSTVAGTPF
jgi:hypothetical protein